MSRGDDPAYPMLQPHGSFSMSRESSGMTIREAFVKAAMKGLLANPSTTGNGTTDQQQIVELAEATAILAAFFADAQLAELAKPVTTGTRRPS